MVNFQHEKKYGKGVYVNIDGGIYHYVDGKVRLYYENYDGFFHSTFSNDGDLYAVDPFGKVFIIDNEGNAKIISGLFNNLKTISFSSNDDIIYVSTFGGGMYRITDFKKQNANTN